MDYQSPSWGICLRMEDSRAQVIDVGMHTGEDARRFLAAGLRVVAIEANPALVEDASKVFAGEIETGQLTIVGAAISDERGSVRFGVNDEMTVWSSLDPAMIARNEQLAGSSYRYVDVKAVLFGDVLDEFGTPHYLKVDIEGLDMLCVRALRGRLEKPQFISIESSVSVNEAPLRDVTGEVLELWRLGYRRFRYVDQSRHENEIPNLDGWAGPPWQSAWRALALAQLLRTNHNLAGYGGKWTGRRPGRLYKAMYRRPAPWWDLHAALPAVVSGQSVPRI
jgi:FkbM family methyltransferase